MASPFKFNGKVRPYSQVQFPVGLLVQVEDSSEGYLDLVWTGGIYHKLCMKCALAIWHCSIDYCVEINFHRQECEKCFYFN